MQNPNSQKAFQAIIGTEENLFPVFLHDPESQTIAGAVLVTESIFGQLFGLNPAKAIQPAPQDQQQA